MKVLLLLRLLSLLYVGRLHAQKPAAGRGAGAHAGAPLAAGVVGLPAVLPPAASAAVAPLPPGPALLRAARRLLVNNVVHLVREPKGELHRLPRSLRHLVQQRPLARA